VNEKRFKCHKISEGVVEGEVLISNDEIMFYLIDPKTGEVLEANHDLENKSVADKILIFPGGKGSSVVQADGLYQLNQNGNLPKAMIIKYPETVLVSSSIIMEIPMVDKLEDRFYDIIEDGDNIKIDTFSGSVTIIDK
jgi:predicted aconitase with swiveling domain